MREIVAGLVALMICSTQANAAPREKLEGKVYLDEGGSICGASGAGNQEIFGAVLAAILPGLIQAGVKGIGNALAKSAEPDEATVSASDSSHYFYGTEKNDDKFTPIMRQKCIVFVVDSKEEIRGRLSFDQQPTGIPNPDNTPGMKSIPRNGNLTERDVDFLAGKGIKHYPLFYYVGRFERSADRSAWRIQPTTIWIGESLTKGGFRRKGRDLVLTLSLLGASTNDDDNTLAAKSINLRRVQRNQWIQDADKLAELATGWIPFPSLPAQPLAVLNEANERLKSIQQIREIPEDERTDAQTRNLTKMEERVASEGNDTTALAQVLPATFKAQVDETRDGIAFLQRVGEFVAGNAEKIATPITNALDSDAQTTAQVQALTNASSLRVSTLEAIANWQSVEADASKTDLEKRIARIRADTACDTLRLNDLAEASCGLLD